MPPSHEERIKTLKLRREAFKLELEAFKDFLDNYESGSSVSRIKVQFDELALEFVTFSKTQIDLDGTDSTGELLRERIALKSAFSTYKARVLDIIEAANPHRVGDASGVEQYRNSPCSHTESYENEITLPKINLPTFAGSYEDWPGFANQFRSTIHQNQRLADTKKLMYLRSCLKGEPAKAIESLENHGSNYSVAWTILEKRLNQPAKIVANHVRHIFEAPMIKRTSHQELRSFLSNTEAHYRALQTFKQPSSDTLLIYLLLSKLDNETIMKWKEHTHNIAFPSLEELFSFLHDRCQILEPSDTFNRASSTPSNVQNNNRNRPFHHNFNKPREWTSNSKEVLATQIALYCNFCKGAHFSQNCEDFLKLSTSDRSQFVKEKNLCINCLRKNHSASVCRASTCKKCHKRHHTLLHLDLPDTPGPATVQSNVTCLASSRPSQVILSTAVINVIDSKGKAHQCRVLLDSCAEAHFLTEKFCKTIGLKLESTQTPLDGMNQMSSEINLKTTAQIKSRWNNYTESLSFLVAKEISQPRPSEFINRHVLDIPAGIHLADPNVHSPAAIDGLIGVPTFWNLLCVGQIALANRSLKLHKTKLGWVVAGELTCTQQNSRTMCNLTLNSLQEDIHKFWNLEECSAKPILSPEEQACEQHYKENTSRDKTTGRYTARLPFKQDKSSLGKSYDTALKRFLSLERSLDKNLSTKADYIHFLQQYEQLGHMSELKSDDNSGYYLPHHAVTKSNSLTTKIRVVFDASVRSFTGVSLNSTLMVGPTIQDDLFAIIIRFRLHKYVLTADISKMYRQINLHANDHKFHKILWREQSDQSIKVFQLNTVTYGTASAPFLAIRTLQQLAQDERHSHPIGADILTKDFYVDDALTGADSIRDAIQIRDDLIALTSKGGFQLRQWISNEPQLLESLNCNTLDEHMTLNISDEKKTLGLFWKADLDTLGYNIKFSETRKITKRLILSRIAQLFDPLGMVGPILVYAKIIMQSLWKLKLDWDESVTIEIHTAWSTFESELPLIHKISIPRRVICGDYKHVQLHGFCDASERAYGACIYIRTTSSDESHKTHLLCSKSRVAPLKTQSLPRLELCAAVLLSKLYNTVKASINIKFERVTFWSDSTITLHWINTPPHTLKPFVANRVSEIQATTEATQWRHVRSEHNPADLLSRGTTPATFLDNHTWYHGPNWISQSEDTWPQHILEPIDIPDRRKTVVMNTIVKSNTTIFERFSSFTHLMRVIAYCLRFSYNTQNKTRRTGSISRDELKAANVCIIKQLQNVTFSEELGILVSTRMDKKSKLTALCPFIDQDGLIRVGGRITNSRLPYDNKHPLLLPCKHHITDLIIREIHIRHGHSGVQGTLHAIRENYWPINGKVAVKSNIRKCITCHKVKPVSVDYIMGQLPKNRVTCNRPFLITGVDYCGPMYIKERKHRNVKRIKVYVAIFICFSTKAVHIELVSDLTSDAFLAALKRFIARRGKLSDVYSDNATNFVGADRELQSTLKSILSHTDDPIHNYLANQGTRWHFNPPRAPHFGGLWEAAVKSLKHHLLRVIGNTLLTYEGLTTCLTEIEAILNSRPLTELSSDPNDTNPLTPGHFLIGESLTSIPEYDLTCSKIGRLSSWQHAQQIRQHFWNRWHKEYLNELTVRKKWHEKSTTPVSIGMLVILKEDNTPPLCWPMGRVLATHPGADGVIRVVTVKTTHGEYKRSIKKIAPLPLYNT